MGGGRIRHPNVSWRPCSGRAGAVPSARCLRTRRARDHDDASSGRCVDMVLRQLGGLFGRGDHLRSWHVRRRDGAPKDE